jgi:hypothetical protein
MDREIIRKEATAYLRDILVAFHQDFPDVRLVGFACECDPLMGIIYVCACERGNEVNVPCEMWTFQYVEQGVLDFTLPPWVERYQKETEGWFAKGTEESDAFQLILDGVAAAMADLIGDDMFEKVGLGGKESCFRSWTASDPDQKTGEDRVARHRRILR